MSAVTAIQRPTWLPAEHWPFQTAALMTPVGRIAVTDIGSGPTLLFVHVGSWSFVWRDLLLQLSPHYRCVALDAPGSGLSAHPDSPVSLRGAARAVGSSPPPSNASSPAGITTRWAMTPKSSPNGSAAGTPSTCCMPTTSGPVDS
jgi:pimeloyl-ACP methyl ester carboxylesterase